MTFASEVASSCTRVKKSKGEKAHVPFKICLLIV